MSLKESNQLKMNGMMETGEILQGCNKFKRENKIISSWSA
jgi:hypothetical protein